MIMKISREMSTLIFFNSRISAHLVFFFTRIISIISFHQSTHYTYSNAVTYAHEREIYCIEHTYHTSQISVRMLHTRTPFTG